MPASKFTVLIVEDDFSLRKSLVLALKRFRFQTLEAANGREAMDLFAREKIHGVLLDAIMPVMDGFETCRCIRQIKGCEHIPILLITGLNDLESIDRAYSAGATDYILKPVHLHVLSHRLLRLVQAVHLETELKQKKVEFDTVFAAIPDPIVLTGPDRTIIAVNRAFEKRFGYEEHELVGEFSQILYADPDDFELEDELLFGEEREPHTLPVFRYRCSSGDTFDGETLGSTMRDTSGGSAGCLHIIRDITERRKAEEERLKADKLATMGLLAGGIAHDFNNIITALSTSIALARAEMPNGSRSGRYLADCEPAMKHAVHLSKQLLTFAKGGAPVKKVLQPDRLVRESVEFALRATRSIARYQIDEDIYPIEADSGQLVQVLSNLVINADQAMPRGGSVDVQVENLELDENNSHDMPPGNAVQITVSDHGCGIPPDVIDKIFDPYFTTKVVGNGLGLATTYAIVHKHGGRISVESQTGIGTTFRIVLPALAQQAVVDEPKAVATGSGGNQAARILLLEDQEIIRRGVTKLLEREEYAVDTAQSGEEAIELFLSARRSGNAYSLLLLDLTLPGGINGVETLKRIRQTDQIVPAIASSGYAEDPVMATPLEFGFDAVLPKPFSREELLRTIHKVLSQGRNPATTRAETKNAPVIVS